MSELDNRTAAPSASTRRHRWRDFEIARCPGRAAAAPSGVAAATTPASSAPLPQLLRSRAAAAAATAIGRARRLARRSRAAAAAATATGRARRRALTASARPAPDIAAPVRACRASSARWTKTSANGRRASSSSSAVARLHRADARQEGQWPRRPLHAAAPCGPRPRRLRLARATLVPLEEPRAPALPRTA